MYCVSCGNALVPGGAFCAHCGQPAAVVDVSMPGVGGAAAPAAGDPEGVNDAAAVGAEAGSGGAVRDRWAKPSTRGWHHVDGDPEGVRRWFNGTAWTTDLTGGTAEEQARALPLPGAVPPPPPRGLDAFRTPAQQQVRGLDAFRTPAQQQVRGLDAFRTPAQQRTAAAARAVVSYPAGYPGARPVPGRLVAASVLLYVSAGLNLLGAIVLLSLGQLAGAFVLVGVILLGVSAAQIWAAVGVVRLLASARSTAMVLAVLAAVLDVVGLARGAYVELVPLGVAVAIIVLLSGEQVSYQFR